MVSNEGRVKEKGHAHVFTVGIWGRGARQHMKAFKKSR